MSLQIALFKIKNEKVQEWKEWCIILQEKLNKEAIETLKEEGLESEFYTIFEIQGGFYTLAGGNRLKEGKITNREINKIHNDKKKECFEKKCDVKILVDLHI